MFNISARSIRRRAFRKSGNAIWPGAQAAYRLVRGGYEALNPTKGWMRFSFKRFDAMSAADVRRAMRK